MGNVGFQEILIILVLALIIFGPKRLPDIARQIGKAVREVKKVSGEFEREVRTNFALDEHHSSYVVPTPPKQKQETEASSAADEDQVEPATDPDTSDDRGSGDTASPRERIGAPPEDADVPEGDVTPAEDRPRSDGPAQTSG